VRERSEAIYDRIYLLTGIRLTRSGSSTVCNYTKQYTEQRNERDYPELSILKNKNT